jgi:GT2 family glycosyltransferase
MRLTGACRHRLGQWTLRRTRRRGMQGVGEPLADLTGEVISIAPTSSSIRFDTVFESKAFAGDRRGLVKVIAVLTCFNRKALTLSCLDTLAASAARAEVELEVILVDDASTDGTATAVRTRFPWVEIIEGTGALFWNRGMREGFARALQRPAHYYLWVNDDTQLLPDALSRLLRQSAKLNQSQGRPVIVVGAIADRASGSITYGGYVARSRLRPFTYRRVWGETESVHCDVMNGNCVLIPHEVAQRVGNLDPIFEHAMGDTDYGLRAKKVGYRLFVAPGIVGYCSRNPLGGTYLDTSLPLGARWKLMRSRKGLPVRSWFHFTKRHGGFLWPLYFSWPYARLLLSGVREFTVRTPP